MMLLQLQLSVPWLLLFPVFTVVVLVFVIGIVVTTVFSVAAVATFVIMAKDELGLITQSVQEIQITFQIFRAQIYS